MNKYKVITFVIIVSVLGFAFLHGEKLSEPPKTDTVAENMLNPTETPKLNTAAPTEGPTEPEKTKISPSPVAPVEIKTENIPEVQKTEQEEPTAYDEKSTAESVAENSDTDKKEHICTLSIRCDTILKNMTRLKSEKSEIVPKNGVILAECQTEFYEGESVFNLLVRETKKNKIHMEFVNTPIYNSAYIEGIANIYEFDCGELSGWMYSVNGQFPNYGCSQYILNDGDVVEWVYTCDLGKDVGGAYSARNGN